jgi:hypothetical protein
VSKAAFAPPQKTKFMIKTNGAPYGTGTQNAYNILTKKPFSREIWFDTGSVTHACVTRSVETVNAPAQAIRRPSHSGSPAQRKNLDKS